MTLNDIFCAFPALFRCFLRNLRQNMVKTPWGTFAYIIEGVKRPPIGKNFSPAEVRRPRCRGRKFFVLNHFNWH